MKLSTKRRVVAGALAFVATVSLSGCGSRQIDKAVAGAVAQQGAPNLYWICLDADPGTALYFTDVEGSSEDEYEFAIYDHQGCMEKYGVAPVASVKPISGRDPRNQEFDENFSDGEN